MKGENMNKLVISAVTTALMICGLSTAVAADKKLTFAIGLPPIHTWSKNYEYVDKHLEARSGGKLESEVYYGSLLNLKQSLTADQCAVKPPSCHDPSHHFPDWCAR